MDFNSIESTDVFPILVKDTATNEIVRVEVTGELSFRVTHAIMTETEDAHASV